MIEVQGITKRYGDRTAVDRLSFEVGRGEILGFLGPNGAGKTTTMRILACYLTPSEGTARVAGFDVVREPMQVKRRIGYLPEHPPLYREMTVEGFLGFVGRIRAVPGRELRPAVDRVIERCGLASVRHRLIGNLSKGFQQRVGLAQALLHNPEVLILDEPTIGLDPAQIQEIRGLIRSLGGDHTVILSTHILPEVQKTCGRVVIIHEGKVVAVDSQEGLAARLRHTDLLSLTVARDGPEVRSRLEQVRGVLSVRAQGDSAGAYLVETELHRDLREEVARLAVERNWGVLEVGRVSLSLEDIFLRLTREEKAG
ncbi:MAG: ATP-binding cassette domain-containing protein [Acidobacteria bacterium]|nr:ATP-binding cassette domain-containing protein [Acidobacteriota bacterium]